MYDTEASTTATTLQTSNPAVFSDTTINTILALTTKTNDTTVRFDQVAPDASGNVTVASGAEVVLVTTSDTTATTIKPPANAPVVIFQGRGGVIATLNDAAATVPSGDQTRVDRVVVGSAGNDKIVVMDARNTQVILGTGDSTVSTGAGVDTVYAGLGNSTIVGGSGDYAVVKLAGAPTNYQVTVNNGHAVVTNTATNKATDISKIQYVQLDNGKALVFAKDSIEASIANLYHTAFGRYADAGGLDYWFDVGRGGGSLKQIAEAFTHSTEFAPYALLDNTTFVQQLYQHTFNRAGDDAGVAYWTDALQHGATRGDLVQSFAQIATQNIMGQAQNQEAQIVGNVTIVTGIV
ncbi:MAG: DUF4214 domain-containing protein [Burkholderiaceae bacterium]|nr:DUF4214 domain-containing protein [Burkholderiaceae bacterium]